MVPKSVDLAVDHVLWGRLDRYEYEWKRGTKATWGDKEPFKSKLGLWGIEE